MRIGRAAGRRGRAGLLGLPGHAGVPYDARDVRHVDARARYVATLVSAVTEGPPPVDSPEIGKDTWVVSVTDAAAGHARADVMLTAERPLDADA